MSKEAEPTSDFKLKDGEKLLVGVKRADCFEWTEGDKTRCYAVRGLKDITKAWDELGHLTPVKVLAGEIRKSWLTSDIFVHNFWVLNSAKK